MSKQYAVINENNEVINIVIVDDNFVAKENYIQYLETNPAYIGGDYFNNYFYSPQPFASWSRDGLGNWQAPKPMPSDGLWNWDEDLGDWVEYEA
jgi:hypothetical protein